MYVVEPLGTCSIYYSVISFENAAGMDQSFDKELVEFSGKCQFQEHMPRKPGKYGINVWKCCYATYPLKEDISLELVAPWEGQIGHLAMPDEVW